MEMEALLSVAVQSSFLLGLLHGVNPCGHSWLVLAPFVSGEKRGTRVALLTIMFLGGTALACLILGATLGAVSQLVPVSIGHWVETITSVILIVIGLLLLYDPHILHGHSHGHNNDDHNNHSSHENCHNHGLTARLKRAANRQKFLPQVLFAIGFVNMIIPCPTAAVMYTYALNSGNVVEAIIVFGTYAVATAMAVGTVIYLIFKATAMAHSLQKDWVEPFVMRFAGGVIIIFSAYGMYQGFAT